MHRHRFEVEPGGRDPTAGSTDRKCFAWAAFDSQTTLLHPSSARSIVWAAGHLYEGRKCCVLWYYQPEKGTSGGRRLNFHTHPAFGGWTQPENPDGVSPIAVDDFGPNTNEGVNGLHLVLQAQAKYGRYHFPIVPHSVMQLGRAYTLALDFDIADTPTGSFRVWLDGQLVVNLTDVRTVFPGMTGVALWEGSYNSSGVPDLTSSVLAPARVGRSREECLRDGVDWPIVEKSIWGSVSRSTGAVAYRHTALPDIGADSYIVPAEWGGTPPPPPGGYIKVSPELPVAGSPVSFTVGDPDDAVTYSWDRTLDGKPEATGLTYEYAYQGPGTKTVVLLADGVEADRLVLDVAPAPPVDPLGLRVVSQDTRTVTLAWNPPDGQQGYVATIDGSQTLTDGKRHASVSTTAKQVRIGKKQDGQPHRYGVDILGVAASSSIQL